jgi:dihydrofolate reductase
MRKLKLQMQLSLDGFVAGPNSEMDWITWQLDEELKYYIQEITASIDHILLGRKLAEGFISSWEGRAANPDANDTFAQQMVNTPKLVFSEKLNSITCNNAELIQGDLTEQINQLKQKPGGDLMAYGGAGFAAALISRNLIDGYYLFINPAAIGKGKGIFNQLHKTLNLKLIKATSFECGITAMHYQPAL